MKLKDILSENLEQFREQLGRAKSDNGDTFLLSKSGLFWK
jgi:hypothetical protein